MHQQRVYQWWRLEVNTIELVKPTHSENEPSEMGRNLQSNKRPIHENEMPVKKLSNGQKADKKQLMRGDLHTSHKLAPNSH